MGSRERIAGIQPFAELAEGPTSIVYKGYQPTLERLVLLKVLRPEYADDDGFARRFEQEAQLIASIQHRNVVAVYACGRDNGHVYIAAEFVDGVDLGRLSVDGACPPDVASLILLQAARGLQAVHHRDILHRDLKPSNVMVSNEGDVKLTDFGLSSREEQSNTDEIRGTMRYLAPEVLLGARASKASDLFSLGALYYELLTGRPAFAAGTAGDTIDRVVHHDPIPALRRTSPVPEALCRVVARLLEKEPQARYDGCEDLILDLESAIAEAYGHVDADDIRRYLEDPRSYRRADVPARAVLDNASLGVEAATISSVRKSRARGPIAVAIIAVLFLAAAYALGIGTNRGQTNVALPLGAVEVDDAGSAADANLTAPSDSDSRKPEQSPPDDASSTGSNSNVLKPQPLNPPTAKTSSVAEGAADSKAESAESRSVAGRSQAVQTKDGLPLLESPGGTETLMSIRTNEDEGSAGSGPGALMIAAEPWATVFMGGQVLGTTPLETAIALDAGTYAIALRNPDFPEYVTSIDVSPAETSVVNVSLWQLVGLLTIEVTPWAYVFVDGTLHDTTPLDEPIILAAGPRQISLRHPDFGRRDTTLQVGGGERLTLRVSMVETE